MNPSDVRDLRRDALRQSLTTLRELPTPSHVLHEIWSALDDQRASASTLAALLAQDTALSARTLRLANSAYFGLQNPVSDVRAACVVLGFETVRALAVGVAALDGLTRAAAGALDIDTFWRHSVAVGTATRELARRMGLPDTGTAFCGGILHDLGRLVLAAVRPAETRALFAAGSLPTRSDESAAFGASHDEVGAWAAGSWRLPSPLRDAIGLHHGGEGAQGWSRWGALVHVADVVAIRAGMPSVPDATPETVETGAGAGAVPPAPSAAALELLHVSPATLESLESTLDAEIARIDDLVDAVGAAR